jgi:hypothetical protein
MSRRLIACAIPVGGLTAALMAGPPCPTNCSAASSPGVADAQTHRAIETKANTYTRYSQTHAALDADADGNVLVVWASKRQEAGSWGVFAQRFDPLGRRVGTETRVNRTSPGTQWRPDVAITPAGDAWAVWESDLQNAVVLRKVADGAGEIIVSDRPAGTPGDATLAVGDDGHVLVCWTEQGVESARVMSRLFDDDGAPLTEATPLASDAGNDSNVAVGVGDGEFVVAWGRADEHGRPASIVSRRLDADAAPLGDELVVTDLASPIEPAVGCDAEGRAVIAWMAERGGSYAVEAARVDRDGSPIGPAWTVAPASTDGFWQSGASVAVADDGRFVISFNRIDPDRPEPSIEEGIDGHRTPHPASVHAVRYSADAVAEGPAYRVNRGDDGAQRLSADRSSHRVVWTGLDQLAFAWSGRTDDADKVGVGLTMFVPEGLDAPAPERVAQVPAPADTDPTRLAPPEPNPQGPAKDLVNALASGPDFGFEGFPATEWTPPDPDLAVGPNHVVAVVNMKIRFFTKDGTLTHDQDLRNSDGFFGSVGGTAFMFDPIAVFDPHTDRFIVGCLSGAGNTEAIFVAISDDADPNGSWNFHRHLTNAQGGFPDFPNMGVDDEAIYFSTDMFDFPTGNWITIFDKQDLIDGVSPNTTSIKLFNDFSSVSNTKTWDADAPAQYLATSFQCSDRQLRLIAIQNQLTSPTKAEFFLTVPRYFQPDDAPQLGSTNRVSTVDQRIKNCVYRDGSLWVTHGVTPNGENRTMVRWYEIAMNGWPDSGLNPTLVQTGDIDPGRGIWTWFPDLDVDEHGNVGLFFNQSSSSERVSMSRAIRRATDPLGTFRAPVIMQTSTSAEPGGRWGDYSGANIDPGCPGKMWGHVEYRTDNWRTWIGSTWVFSIADHNGDGLINSIDFTAFLNDFVAGFPEADVNGDGVVNSLDFVVFLNTFTNPCG